MEYFVYYNTNYGDPEDAGLESFDSIDHVAVFIKNHMSQDDRRRF